MQQSLRCEQARLDVTKPCISPLKSTKQSAVVRTNIDRRTMAWDHGSASNSVVHPRNWKLRLQMSSIDTLAVLNATIHGSGL